jgi:flagellar biogenesis protein FliO
VGGIGPVIWQAFKFLLAFAAVVFLAVATSRWLGGRVRQGGAAALRVVGALQLGGGRSVCAVQVASRVLVLGLGDKQVSLLCALDDPADVGVLAPGPGAAPTAMLQPFARQLRAAIDRAREVRRRG